MLSNKYFLAKFRFDTAENEPAKNLHNFRKMQVAQLREKFADEVAATKAVLEKFRGRGGNHQGSP